MNLGKRRDKPGRDAQCLDVRAGACRVAHGDITHNVTEAGDPIRASVETKLERLLIKPRPVEW